MKQRVCYVYMHVLTCHFQIFGVRAFLWLLSLIFNLDSVTWDDKVVDGLNFMASHVLQVPLFLMTLMRYVTPTVDNLYVSLYIMAFACSRR